MLTMTLQQEIAQEIQKAVDILHSGGVVALPTETVYGLAADAGNASAVSKIYSIKERPGSHPLIVHLGDLEQMAEWACDIPDIAYQLALAFWPGPLTLVLKKQSGVSDVITAGQPTVAVRMPRHPVAQAVLQAFGSGLVAPSANKFTHISPTTAKAVREELGDDVDLILDGGTCDVGLESTIVDLTQDKPRILRPGMLGATAISEVINQPVQLRRQDFPGEEKVRVPGMHHLHYAPTTPTRLLKSLEVANQLQEAAKCNKRSVFIIFNDLDEKSLKLAKTCENVEICQLSQKAHEYAQKLYLTLRNYDTHDFSHIYVECVPDSEEWDAVRDRLQKACGQ